MDDLTAILERYASRGEPRGAATVLRNAYTLMDDDRVALVDAAKPRDPRRGRLALAGVLVVAILGLIAWQVTKSDDRNEPVVTTPATGEGLSWVPNTVPDAVPQIAPEVARGSDQGHHWLIGAHRFSDGDVQLHFAANWIAASYSSGAKPFPTDKPSWISSTTGGTPDGGLTPTYSYGTVPPATQTVRVTTEQGEQRVIEAQGDPAQLGIRFFAVADEHPIDGVMTLDALGTDGRSLGVATVPTSVPAPRSNPRTGVSTRIELPKRTLRAGSTIRATLVVTNPLGKVGEIRTFDGCTPHFRLVIRPAGSTDVRRLGGECEAKPLVLRKGRTLIPIQLKVAYSDCASSTVRENSSECRDGGTPSLAAGRYTVFLQDNGARLPTPAPVSVRVVHGS